MAKFSSKIILLPDENLIIGQIYEQMCSGKKNNRFFA